MNFQVPIDPFQGLAVSVVTSNTIDLRDAWAASFSNYTSAGTGSNHTIQLSNASVELQANDGLSVAEASWVDRLAVSVKTWVELPDGSRYARILRTPSQASWVFDVVKHVR